MAITPRKRPTVAEGRKSRSTRQRKMDALTWFTDTMGELISPRTSRRIRNEDGLTQQTFMKWEPSHDFKLEPGRMFAYVYDPKWKKELPYYDTFPLMVVLEVYEDGFLGLNLHYLPPTLRFKLVNKMYETSQDGRKNPRARTALNYAIITATSRLNIARPAIKRYLFSHVRSKMKSIPATDWRHVAWLPLENFSKMTKEQVWKESSRIISKRNTKDGVPRRRRNQ